jgi:predicted transcriptional regulator
MLVSDLLSNEVFSLKKDDKISAAKIFFEDWRQQQLPVVSENKVLGMVLIDDIREQEESDKIDKYIRPYQIKLPQTRDHIFELIKLFSLSGLSCLPVLQSDEGKYEGIVTATQLLSTLGESSLAQPGSIINLEFQSRDYSLAELSRIIEYNDQKIIGLFLFPADKESSKITASLKLTTTEVKSVLAALERYGYVITSVHQFSDSPSDMSGRLDWLLKYLNT